MVSGEAGIRAFLFFETIRISSPVSPRTFFVSLFDALRACRFVAEAVISCRACLDAPIFLPLTREDLGVKKRVNVLGVTVGFFLGLLEPSSPGSGRGGEDGNRLPGVKLLSESAMVCGEIGSSPAIITVYQTLNKRKLKQNLD